MNVGIWGTEFSPRQKEGSKSSRDVGKLQVPWHKPTVVTPHHWSSLVVTGRHWMVHHPGLGVRESWCHTSRSLRTRHKGVLFCKRSPGAQAFLPSAATPCSDPRPLLEAAGAGSAPATSSWDSSVPERAAPSPTEALRAGYSAGVDSNMHREEVLLSQGKQLGYLLLRIKCEFSKETSNILSSISALVSLTCWSLRL